METLKEQTQNNHKITTISPKEWREQGQNVVINYGYGLTPFGEALIGITDKGICHLAFIDQNKEEIFEVFTKTWERATFVHEDNLAKEYLTNIFEHQQTYPLYLKGTNLQINVWQALLRLPSGSLSTYQDIAISVGNPKAVRAVANAIAHNNIAYLIPCHRVIAKSGAMSGYRWGVERKRILIALENV